MATRVIVDTNIVISLEEHAVVDETAARLLALLQTNDVHVLIHPASVEDILNDKDEERKAIKLSKLKKYTELNSPPKLDTALFAAKDVHIGGNNDVIDCTILSALLKDAVHFLITEDRRLHRKARKLGLGERTLTVEQGLSYFGAAFANQPIRLPNLDSVELHQIRDELPEKFFDSLRNDYPEFDEWFVRCCKEGRSAWVAHDDGGNLGAIGIYKEESNPQVTPTHKLSGRVLKLCTLKVEGNVRGQKIGELLLKAAFRHSTKNNFEKIYVTAKDKHHELIELLREFGFESIGINDNQDQVLVKNQPLTPPSSPLSPVEYHIKFAPHFKAGPTIKKFLVPIQPEYHELLFPDASDRQLKFSFVGPLPGNAIKLAYLCRAKTKSIRPGDVLVFYRSHDLQQCTTLGIVESVGWLDDADIILERVLKRTVYTRNEIEEICHKGCLVILFRLQSHFINPITLSTLKTLDVIGPVQSIRKLTDEQFRRMAKLGEFEGSILAD
ncbi:MAG TPA: GNAT family N-acetyltransferase [Planktothrix sp.]